MVRAKQLKSHDKSRSEIANKVRTLRKSRAWTQAELARKLNLSQSRLSEIEGGGGSFTAEQFLTILQLFNVPVDHFARVEPSLTADLQNALARFGASHLRERTDVVPSARFSEPEGVVRETLIAADSPRLITALAPVIVRNIERLKLRSIDLDLSRAGAERRLGWVVENTRDAVVRDSRHQPPPPWGRLYRRAEVVFETFLEWASKVHRDLAVSETGAGPLDVIDADIRSHQSLLQVKHSSSQISRRWGIVTSIQPDDFFQAMRAARDAA